MPIIDFPINQQFRIDLILSVPSSFMSFFCTYHIGLVRMWWWGEISLSFTLFLWYSLHVFDLKFIPWLAYPNIKNHNGVRKTLSVQFPGTWRGWLVSSILLWLTHFTPQQAVRCGQRYPAISIQSEGDKNNLASSVSSRSTQSKGQSVSPAPAFQRETWEEGITPSIVHYKNIYSY